MNYRIESDVLGNVKVPSDAYYGSETQRAIDNFQISGLRVHKDFISAYAMLKKAAALANMRTKRLDSGIGNAIVKASDEVILGKLSDQFTLDVFQAGAGTSINMNLNEVIANRALEILHKRRGDYKTVNPNDHVNMSQSTNDTFPSTIHIATSLALRDELIPSLNLLRKTLKRKSAEFRSIVKVGRTHLQDAVPITLGQEFSGYAGMIEEVTENVAHALRLLQKIPLGGTAVGTGINSTDAYANEAVKEISKMTGIKFIKEKNPFAGQSSRCKEVMVSESLISIAIALNKIANDFRLLASGPKAGMGELLLPEVQPGSSIMPGKINPSMAEMLNMVCFETMGNCTTIEEAANSGQLELNVFMPIIAFNLLFTIRILSNGIRSFNDKCVSGIKPNTRRISEIVDKDLSIVTSLSPYIGYAKAAEIARAAYKQDKTIKQVCLEKKILDRKTLDRLLNPKNLV